MASILDPAILRERSTYFDIDREFGSTLLLLSGLRDDMSRRIERFVSIPKHEFDWWELLDKTGGWSTSEWTLLIAAIQMWGGYVSWPPDSGNEGRIHWDLPMSFSLDRGNATRLASAIRFRQHVIPFATACDEILAAEGRKP